MLSPIGSSIPTVHTIDREKSVIIKQSPKFLEVLLCGALKNTRYRVYAILSEDQKSISFLGKKL